MKWFQNIIQPLREISLSKMPIFASMDQTKNPLELNWIWLDHDPFCPFCKQM